MEATENLDQVITTTSTNGSLDMSIMSLITSADLVGKIVILILFLASLWSWAIVAQKYLLLLSIKKKMKNFEDIFWSGQVIDDLYEKVKKMIDNPLSAIFVNAINECKKSKLPEAKKTDAFKLSQKERVSGSMYLVKNRELESLDTNLSFLATVGSSAPFIGLFGTVWGIMHSFQSIAASKNTSLAVVAPGIAEALLATAIGLFVAIPATIFYNYLSSQIDSIDNKTEDFIGELNCLISRAIDEEKM
jgi:biopolymer transport protein TolQ